MESENSNVPRSQNSAGSDDNIVKPIYYSEGERRASSPLNPNQATTSFSQASLSNKKRKLFTGIVVLAVLLLGTGAGAFFGIYVPNKPDNIWKKALNNTAAGYDKLVEYSESQKNNKGGTIKGNFKLDADQAVIDGSLETKYFDKNSVSKVDIGTSGTRINFDLLTNTPEGSKNPDLYAKVSGLKGVDKLLGSEGAGLGQALASYDNQWFVADHTLFDQLEKEAAKSAGSQPALPSLSQEDITSIARATGGVNREYLFTDNQNKAVLKRTQNIGKEKLDERDSYHYKVGYNKQNLKAYINALKNELKKTKLKDYVSDQQYNDAVASVDKLDGNGQADAWVDHKTKLIRKVRFTDKDQKEAYVDVGLKYNGGDEYPFFVSLVGKQASGEGKANIGLTLNAENNTIKLSSDVDAKSEGKPYKFNLGATLTPGNNKVDFKKPDNVKSLLEAYSQLTGDGLNTQSLLQPAPGVN